MKRTLSQSNLNNSFLFNDKKHRNNIMKENITGKNITGKNIMKKNIEFQIIDWYSDDIIINNDYECDDDDDDNNDNNDKYQQKSSQKEFREYMIRLFGVDNSGNTVSCQVTGFNPFFYVKIPNDWDSTKAAHFVKTQITHREVSVQRYDRQRGEKYYEKGYKDRNFAVKLDSFNSIDNNETIWCSMESALVRWKLVQKHDIDAGFTGIPAAKFKFIKLVFKTLSSMKQCFYNLRKEKEKLRISIYEANIDPQLRFMHMRNILAAGWVVVPPGQFTVVPLDEKQTHTNIEISTRWDQICPLENDDIAPLRQASFDIECYSCEPNKMPVPDILGNPIIQIGTVFQNYGKPDHFERYIVTLKKCLPIPDTHVISCDTEEQLLLEWQKLLIEKDPDVLYGYNIFGFDLNYIMVRADVLGCEQFKHLGKMKFIQSHIEHKTLSSAAYGDNHFKMVPMPGRLQIDILQILMRDPLLKFPTYKLEYTSSQILSVKLHDNPIKTTKGESRIFIAHKNHSYSVGQVIHLFNIDETGGYEYEELNKVHMITEIVYDMNQSDTSHQPITLGYYVDMWKPATETSQGGGDDDPKVFETKYDLSPSELFAKFKSGTPEEITEIARYCVQDCMLPQKMVNKNNILINTLEMAKVTYVPTSYLITRGQQIKVFSQIAKIAREHNYLLNTVETARDDDEDELGNGKKKKKEKYQGATVLEPKTGSYWDCVFTLDFEALYPTTEIDWNLCYTTLVKDKRYLNLPNVKYLHKTIGTQTYVFAQSEKGLVPKILEHLLKARKKAKRQMAEASPAKKSVYDGQQLAFKISCNSVYGFTGCVETGMLPCKPIAEMTTNIGREMIEHAKKFAENNDNFRDIMSCTTHFPLDYTYLVEKSKGKYEIMTGEDLLKHIKGSNDNSSIQPTLIQPRSIQRTLIQPTSIKIWTTEEFQPIVSYDSIQTDSIRTDCPDKQNSIQLFRFGTEKGTVPDMQQYSVCTIYGDTDSTFNHLNTKHYDRNCFKLAYAMIVGSYVAAKITKYLRSINPFRAENEKWTNLQYEKVYLELLLLAKKRYVGSLYDFNPYRKKYIDKKGVAMKRRDYCKFVQETFRDILKCFFDENELIIANRIENAKNITHSAVNNLLNNKVPFEKLILTKLLKERYKVRDQKKANSFNENNIFENDIISWNLDGELYEGIVKKKQIVKFNANNFFHDSNNNPSNKIASNKIHSNKIHSNKIPSNNQQKPLIVQVTSINDKKVPSYNNIVKELRYSEIIQKRGYEITLTKIMDPNTKESELDKVTQPHARLARRLYKRDPGSAPSSGMRLQFMFVENKNPNAHQHEKSEDPAYVRTQNLKPDPIYYLEHQLKTPLMQLFTLLMDDPESLFREPMRKYRNKQIGQRDITSFFKIK